MSTPQLLAHLPAPRVGAARADADASAGGDDEVEAETAIGRAKGQVKKCAPRERGDGPPNSGTWTTLAAQRQTRQYHSTALLLPDGRVLSAGGGLCGTCDAVGYLAKDAEVFSPPYLFDDTGARAVRPSETQMV